MAGGTKRGKLNQVQNWLSNAKLEAASGQDVDRITAQIDKHEIDNSLSASANYRIIKKEYGLKTKTEWKEYLRDMDEQSRKRVRDEIERQIDTHGVEAICDALADLPVDEATRRDVDSLLDDGVPPDAFDAVLHDHIGELLEAAGADLNIVSDARLEAMQDPPEPETETDASTEPDPETADEAAENTPEQEAETVDPPTDATAEATEPETTDPPAATPEPTPDPPARGRYDGLTGIVRCAVDIVRAELNGQKIGQSGRKSSNSPETNQAGLQELEAN